MGARDDSLTDARRLPCVLAADFAFHRTFFLSGPAVALESDTSASKLWTLAFEDRVRWRFLGGMVEEEAPSTTEREEDASEILSHSTVTSRGSAALLNRGYPNTFNK